MNKFYQPTSKDQLVETLKLKNENVIILAGGTDVMIELKQDKIFDKDFIDLTKISEFDFIKENESTIEIGAITSIQKIADNNIIQDKIKSLAFASRHLGSKQIRNRATIGGNIANASQSADIVPVLLSLDASCEIINSKNEIRISKLDDLIIGRGKTNLKQDEVITKIVFNKPSTYNYFAKLGSRKEVTISKINCAMNFVIEDKTVKDVIIFIGAIGIRAIRGYELEKYLKNKQISEINNEEIKNIGFNIVEQAIPTRESKYYKRCAIYGVFSDIFEKLRFENEI